MRILLILVLTIGSLIQFESASAARLVKLESMSWDEVCGIDENGETSCLKSYGDPTVVPDSVTALKHAFSNEHFSCGLDSGNANGKVKCWKDWTGTEKVDGATVPKAIRKFLKAVKPETVQLATTGVCGEIASTGELHCLLPEWNSIAKKSLKVKPTAKLTAISLDYETVCWGDGDSSQSKIFCRSDRAALKLPNDMKMKGLIEIAVRADRVCARSKSESQCWSPKGIAVLPLDITTAKTWSFMSDGLCVLTQDSRVACVDPLTGAILPSGLGNSIPPEYVIANPDVAKLWTSDSGACVVDVMKNVKCWPWWNATAEPIFFSRPVEYLFGANYQPCAMLDNGQVECRLTSYDSQTLKSDDRIRVAFGGWNKCFWNSSGIDCRGRVDNFSFRSVKDFATSQDGETICAVGISASDPAAFESVQCASYHPEMKAPPVELKNPTNVAASSEQACALSDEGLTCWGQPYPELAPPTTVIQPTRLVMGSRHACLIDQFGLACWGELAALELEIPQGLDQPGRVTDVAVGSSRTCAIIDSGTVECWGRDYELSGPPPVLNGAISITGRGGLFCATDKTGLHCWGGDTSFPK